MRISKLYLPAVAVVGAVALAGCGGGSDSPMKKTGGGGCDAPKIKDGDDCLTLEEYRAKIAKEIEEENKKTDTAKEKVADASALYDRLVTATTATGDDQIFTYAAAAANSVPDTVKDEHKGIEILYRDDGMTWLAYAAANGSEIGAVNASGSNAGYYPLLATSHPIKADSFTNRVGQQYKNGVSFGGAYNGIQGTFKCIGDPCTTVPAADDELTLVADQWLFRPTSTTAKSQGTRAAVWGWWMAGTGDKAGTEEIRLRYAVRNAANDDNETARSTFPAAGEATYTGKALGQYAVVDGADSESGAFEATASLTAKFATETMLSGRVHNFDVNSDWEVTLEEGGISSGVFSGDTVWKTGDEDGLGKGDWQANLYGGTNNATTEPTHVVGGFTAVDAGARMVGAFGAEPPKQE